MIGALLYLQFRSTANQFVSRIKRLKKPKYLAGFLVGGFYFYFYFFRTLLFPSRKSVGAAPPELTPDILAGLEPVGAALLFIIVLFKWVLPHERAALNFTEAEVTFLFPAPVKRRTLIHFKLLKSQMGILFSTLLMAFLSNRVGQGGAAWIHLVGWWILFSTLNLHFLGASFARTRMLDAGITNTQRRIALLAVVMILLGAVIYWTSRTITAPTNDDLADLRAMWTYATRALDTGAASILLYPFRIMVRPFLAQDAIAFLNALWPAATLLVLHYVWVIRSDVAFEEASADLARKRAELISAARQSGGQIAGRKPKRPPFALASIGPTPVALLWKNLIGAGSMFTPRMWIVLACVFGLPAVVFSMNAGSGPASSIVGMLVLMGVIWSLLAGPQILRQDFRQDLRMVDVLKIYPLAGWRVVLGELLAPAVILAAVQWFLLLLGVVVLTQGPDGAPVPLTARLSVAAGAAMVLPLIDLISLLIPNAAVLIFPAWFQTGQEGAHGVEATGQRLIFAIGQLLAFLVALIPAVMVFALVFFVARFGVGWVAAVPLASMAAAVALAAEVALGIGFLGKIFERFDLSADGQT